jgi:hypothetical protein
LALVHQRSGKFFACDLVLIYSANPAFTANLLKKETGLDFAALLSRILAKRRETFIALNRCAVGDGVRKRRSISAAS